MDRIWNRLSEENQTEKEFSDCDMIYVYLWNIQKNHILLYMIMYTCILINVHINVYIMYTLMYTYLVEIYMDRRDTHQLPRKKGI